jgi:hypothetical protein
VLADLRDGASLAGQTSCGQFGVVADLHDVKDREARFRHADSVAAAGRSLLTSFSGLAFLRVAGSGVEA